MPSVPRVSTGTTADNRHYYYSIWNPPDSQLYRIICFDTSEKSRLLLILIEIDRFSAIFQEICAGFEILEDTLVLRLEGGAEYYVPVFARYASQAFGTPLEQLSFKHGSQVPPCCCCRVVLLLSRHAVHRAMPAMPSVVSCCCCHGIQSIVFVFCWGIVEDDIPV